MKLKNKIIAGIAAGLMAIGLSAVPANAVTGKVMNAGASGSICTQYSGSSLVTCISPGQTDYTATKIVVMPGTCVSARSSSRPVSPEYRWCAGSGSRMYVPVPFAMTYAFRS